MTTVNNSKAFHSPDLLEVKSQLEPPLLVGVLLPLPVSLELGWLGEVGQVGGGCEHPTATGGGHLLGYSLQGLSPSLPHSWSPSPLPTA